MARSDLSLGIIKRSRFAARFRGIIQIGSTIM